VFDVQRLTEVSDSEDKIHSSPSGHAGSETGPDRRSEADHAASKVVRFADFRWDGIEVRAYKEPDLRFRGVVRHPLVGDVEGTPFHVRYFEVEPGGYTTLERHQHQHVVLPIRGRGEVFLGGRWEPLGFGDVVYVAPSDAHQFRTIDDEPFGFVCIVAAERDRPEPL
jgi:quercetin dioxygenase-like cupin family protein